MDEWDFLFFGVLLFGVMGYLIAAGDEAGDVGFKFGRGSSDYFVFALALTDDPERLREQLIVLKKKLGMKAIEEFKFFKMSNSRRKRFFDELHSVKYLVRAIAIDKRNLNEYWKGLNKSEFLSEVVAILASSITQINIQNCDFLLDEFDETRRAELRIRQKLRGLGTPARRIIVRSSKNEILIQMADMCAGSIMRNIESGYAFHEIEKSKFQVMRL